jgi:hypothetical protein
MNESDCGYFEGEFHTINIGHMTVKLRVNWDFFSFPCSVVRNKNSIQDLIRFFVFQADGRAE